MGFLVSRFPEPLPLSSRYRRFGKQPRFPSAPRAPADLRERRLPRLREASSRPRHSSLSISRRRACAVNNKVLRPPWRTLRPLSVFYPRVLGKSGPRGFDQEPDLRLALGLELRLRLGSEERQAAGSGAGGGGRGRGSCEDYGGGCGPWRGSQRLQPLHSRASHIQQEEPAGEEPEPTAPQPPQPVRPAPLCAMAKEGVEKAEETEQMIEKEAGKEPAEGGGGSHRLGDAQEMRAVVLAGFGGLNKLRVTRKAMPEPQDGELKIRVKAWSSIRVFLAFSLCALGVPGAGVAEPRRGRCAGKSGRGRLLRALPGSQILPLPAAS